MRGPVRPLLVLVAAALAAVSVLGLAGCGGGEPGGAGTSGARPEVVVTYPVLGSVVRDLVGDRADVTVLMPNGIDPHDWQPSAKDIERVQRADLVVANGLDLEEGLDEALAQAERDGVPVFEATDHVAVRRIGEDEVARHGHRGGTPGGEAEHVEDHAPGAPDSHFWTDPASMRGVAAALAADLGALGVRVADRAADLDARLASLDAEAERKLASVPAARRRLVTGHESLGYFARRYGFHLVGAIVPGLSSQGRASAGELADLVRQIEREKVDVVFTEVGTPRQVAEAIADEAGAEVVELPSHNLPADGSYFTFVRDLAARVAQPLS